MGLKHFLKLARPWQWYKNFIIFLPLIFALKLFNIDLWIKALIGFASFCLASSGNYFLNDVVDYKADRLNPEKRHRPIASGVVKPWQGVIGALLLYAVSILLALYLNLWFLMVLLSFIILTLTYSLFLKKELFADITVIGINFVLRAVGGVFAINLSISSWLIVSVFFLAVFLASAKRYSEASMFGLKAIKHRQVLQHYTKNLSLSLLDICTSILLVSYVFYSFQSNHQGLVYSMPLAFYAVLRYHYLVRKNHKIARHPELFVKDSRLLIATLFWAFVVFIALYSQTLLTLITRIV